MKHTFIAVILLIGLLIGLAFSAWARSYVQQGLDSPQSKTLEIERLVIRDKQGFARAIFGEIPKPGSSRQDQVTFGLQMFDSAGRLQAVVATSTEPNGDCELVFLDERGLPTCAIGHGPAGRGVWISRKDKADIGASMIIDRDGRPCIDMSQPSTLDTPDAPDSTMPRILIEGTAGQRILLGSIQSCGYGPASAGMQVFGGHTGSAGKESFAELSASETSGELLAIGSRGDGAEALQFQSRSDQRGLIIKDAKGKTIWKAQ